MTMHECRAKDCSQIIDSHLLFCLKHWRMIPAVLQAHIYKLWRDYRHNRPGAFEAHQKAIADAIAIVAVHEAEDARAQKSRGALA
jgi:hypothetical protein